MKKSRAITRALIIEGIALIRDTTAILRPSLREIMRRGLKTRSILMTLMNWMFMLLKIIDISYRIKGRFLNIERTYRKDNDQEIHDVPRYPQVRLLTIEDEAIDNDLED